MTWLQPYPGADAERRETIELAFIAALQRLPPRQTAAVVLCDVLDFSAAESAAMLDVTPTAVKGLLQRGRRALGPPSAPPPPTAPGATPRSPPASTASPRSIWDPTA